MNADWSFEPVEAPWSKDQVAALVRFQMEGAFHPYTCPRRTDSPHDWYENDLGSLMPTSGGLLCRDCGYLQTSAYMFSFEVA